MLQSISQGAKQAHTETRNILSGIGKLDVNTESYIAESSACICLALNELEAKISETETHDEISDNKKYFLLQVTTCEGDTIDIKFKQAESRSHTTFGNAVSVSFEVEGNLSIVKKPPYLS